MSVLKCFSKGRDFDCTTYHLALTYIMKSKPEPARGRIKMLLEVLCSSSFHLCYMKGKEMTLSTFLSKIKVGKSNHPEIIPISSDLLEVLQENIILTLGLRHKNSITIKKCVVTINLDSLIWNQKRHQHYYSSDPVVFL